MAARKTGRPAKKTTKSEPPTAGANRRRKQRRKTSHMGEIIAICAITSAILLGIGIYVGGGGAAGQALNGIFKGLFGFGALLLPPAAAWLGISMILQRFELPEARTVRLCFGLFFCIIMLAHVLTREDIMYESFSAYASAAFKAGAAVNGGLFGALAGDGFVKILGIAGTYIAIIAVGLVLIILLTDKSIFQGLLYGIDKAKRLRPERQERLERQERPAPLERPERFDLYDEPAKAKAPGLRKHEARDPRKATVTIEERAEGERPKILLFNDSFPSKKRLPLENIPQEKRASPAEDFLPEDDFPQDDYPPELYVETAMPEVPRPAYKFAYKQASAYKPAYTPEPERKPAYVPEPVDEQEYVPEPTQETVYMPEPEIEPPNQHEPEITTLRHREPEEDPPFDVDEPAEEYYVETSTGKSDMELLKERMLSEKLEEENRRTLAKAETMKLDTKPETLEYTFPTIELLNRNPVSSNIKGRAQILENSRKLESTLKSFGVEAKVVEVSKGPTVTRYELSPGQGVKVSKIAGLADDLALNLAAVGIRIEAPIPGKAAVGIEIPNKEVTPVFLREVIEDVQFQNFPSKLAFALGKDIAGNTVVTDIARMPHLLIAGATGSGKSVCVNTLITSLLYKSDPNEVKLVMIDPKVVELSVYNGVPHLLIPVVTEPRKAAGALNWAVSEMLSRYSQFAETSVRDLKGYNAILKERGETPLPQIVIIIDELADLMMAAPGEVEEAICRLAQMARAAGLHLIIATQRPSVDVITGLIKANIPSRLAFSVSSGTDSRTILDTVGAEKLLGKGDMLFYPVGMSKPQRVQGAFISDKEVENIVAFVKSNAVSVYDQEMINKITSAKSSNESTGEVDELFIYAAEFVIEKDKASASMLQRQFRIGYNKAARLIEELESHGIVGPEDGSKPRKVLMNSFQWGEYKESLVK